MATKRKKLVSYKDDYFYEETPARLAAFVPYAQSIVRLMELEHWRFTWEAKVVLDTDGLISINIPPVRNAAHVCFEEKFFMKDPEFQRRELVFVLTECYFSMLKFSFGHIEFNSRAHGQTLMLYNARDSVTNVLAKLMPLPDIVIEESS